MARNPLSKTQQAEPRRTIINSEAENSRQVLHSPYRSSKLNELVSEYKRAISSSRSLERRYTPPGQRSTKHVSFSSSIERDSSDSKKVLKSSSALLLQINNKKRALKDSNLTGRKSNSSSIERKLNRLKDQIPMEKKVGMTRPPMAKSTSP